MHHYLFWILEKATIFSIAINSVCSINLKKLSQRIFFKRSFCFPIFPLAIITDWHLTKNWPLVFSILSWAFIFVTSGNGVDLNQYTQGLLYEIWPPKQSCPFTTLPQPQPTHLSGIPFWDMRSHQALHLLHFQHLITHIRVLEVGGELGAEIFRQFAGWTQPNVCEHMCPLHSTHKSFLTLFIWLQEWWLSQPIAWASHRFTPGGTLAIVQLKKLPWPLTPDRRGVFSVPRQEDKDGVVCGGERRHGDQTRLRSLCVETDTPTTPERLTSQTHLTAI